MTAVKEFPEKVFLWAEQKVTVTPEASQGIVPGTVGATRLSGEFPFRLRQTFRLEKQVSLAAFHLMDLEATLARGAC
jgi:hypothetical protein